jgi:hypothetical protein
MTSKYLLHGSSHKQKIGERALRLPKGTRKHIRRLKQEGNLKEAALVKNAATEQKDAVHPKPD